MSLRIKEHVDNDESIFKISPGQKSAKAARRETIKDTAAYRTVGKVSLTPKNVKLRFVALFCRAVAYLAGEFWPLLTTRTLLLTRETIRRYKNLPDGR